MLLTTSEIPSAAMKKIKIDPEFRDYMPVVEGDDLEELIVRDGCRDPIILWEGHDILVDGHRRHAICEKHGLGFKVVEEFFASREDVLNFIDELACARRNLSPEEFSLRRGRIYNRLKQNQGGDRRSSPQNEDLKKSEKSRENSEATGRTAEKLAAKHKVSKATIERDGEFASAVDKVKKDGVDLDIEREIAAGTAPPKARILKSAKAPTKKQAKAILAGGEAAAEPAPTPPKRKNGAEVWSARQRLTCAKAWGKFVRLFDKSPLWKQYRGVCDEISAALEPEEV